MKKLLLILFLFLNLIDLKAQCPDYPAMSANTSRDVPLFMDFVKNCLRALSTFDQLISHELLTLLTN